MEMVSKEELKRLIDEMPASELGAAQRFLEFLKQREKGPLDRALEAAPIDDEPITDDEQTAAKEAKRDILAGRIRSHDDVRRQLYND